MPGTQTGQAGTKRGSINLAIFWQNFFHKLVKTIRETPGFDAVEQGGFAGAAQIVADNDMMRAGGRDIFVDKLESILAAKVEEIIAF